MNNINKQKQIQGQIADASGHTDFLGTLDEAVATIMENVKKAGKWAYINGNPFNFSKFDDNEAAQVRALLDSVDEPFFTLTGKLQGGARRTPTVRVRTVKQPISQILNERQRAQLVVSISSVNGQEFVDAYVTSYSGAKERLKKASPSVVAAVLSALNN